LPLENITDGLEQDALITIGLIEDLYSLPKIKLISEDRYLPLIEASAMIEDETNPISDSNFATEYRELPLKVEKDEKGNYTKTDSENYVKITPEDLTWEGTVKIKGQSIVADSELLERVTTVEMANMLLPLFAQPREIVLKPIKEILRVYNKDPQDWLPDAWLNPEAAMFQTEQQTETTEAPPGEETVVPPSEIDGPLNSAKELNPLANE